MNNRQRTLETKTFGNPDRIPLSPGGGRELTMKRWWSEGLPKRANSADYAYRQAGGVLNIHEHNPVNLFVNYKMIPQFEEKVIEKKENTQIVQDWKGNICEISNEFTVKHLREAVGLVTRRWLKCPVENREDWKAMMKRYDSNATERLPENLQDLVEPLKNRTNYLQPYFNGPYWQLREWMGFEGLSMMFYDDPVLVKDMIAFWEDYVLRLMERLFEVVIPDGIEINEDMAYKQMSMLSPDMVREFLLPTWKRWGNAIRKAGVPIYNVDSDGYVGELIPLWIEAGINCNGPVEVAAGNDIVKFRKEFGKEMAYTGGVDKRLIAKGGIHIEQEIERLRPVIEGGGFIPGCDHAVPHDVSWNNYVYYVKLLAKETGWL